jgi:hypothetical protein
LEVWTVEEPLTATIFIEFSLSKSRIYIYINQFFIIL